MKKLAIAVIHGMGSHGTEQLPDTAKPVFSKDLHKRIRERIGTAKFDDNVAWREIMWSYVTENRQADFLKKVKRGTRYDELRKFVVHNLGDASAYQLTKDTSNDTYQRIHAEVARVIAELDSDVEDGAPLLVLAHSLGGHIMSNYIYDTMKCPPAGTSKFQKLRRLAGFITFGCNIPLFTFSYDAAQIFPISYPGIDIPQDERLMPWWLNYYDRDDILGFPLRDISPGYTAMVARGEMKEKAINVGGVLTSWNPASHIGYWRDDDFYKPVADLMKRFL